MAEAQNMGDRFYAALRSDLISVLMEQHSQGRFAQASTASGQARSFFLHLLTHSIADILVLAYPKPDAKAYAAVFADAEAIATAVLADLPATIH